MNDFYLRKNGKAIIFDEEGVETSREYEDGMKTILESENRVEKIEKNKGTIQKTMTKFVTVVLYISGEIDNEIMIKCMTNNTPILTRGWLDDCIKCNRRISYQYDDKYTYNVSNCMICKRKFKHEEYDLCNQTTI